MDGILHPYPYDTDRKQPCSIYEPTTNTGPSRTKGNICTRQPHASKVPLLAKRSVPDKMPGAYFGLSVFACICCFCPTGICAVIYSMKTAELLAEKDIEGAERASIKTVALSMISICIQVCLLPALVLAWAH